MPFFYCKAPSTALSCIATVPHSLLMLLVKLQRFHDVFAGFAVWDTGRNVPSSVLVLDLDLFYLVRLFFAQDVFNNMLPKSSILGKSSHPDCLSVGRGTIGVIDCLGKHFLFPLGKKRQFYGRSHSDFSVID